MGLTKVLADRLRRRRADVPEPVRGDPWGIDQRLIEMARTTGAGSLASGQPSARAGAVRTVRTSSSMSEGVVGQLEADAVLGDKSSGRYADVSRLRAIDPTTATTSRSRPAQRRAISAGSPAAGSGGVVR